MVRKYKRKTLPKYNQSDLKKAVNEVKAGTRKVYGAAQFYKIPKTTLIRWCRDVEPRRIGSGGNTVLSREEEGLIATALDYLAQCGFPQTRRELQEMVQSYLKSLGRANPFKDDKPGEDWIIRFEKRNREVLTRRKPEILTMQRAKGLTQPLVDAFFDMYEKVLGDNGLLDQPHRIFNLDETGLGTDRRSTAVYVSKGSRDAYLKSPSCGKTNFSVLFCVSASGVYLPPFTVYKSKHLYDSWTIGGPKGAGYGCNDSGYMMDFNFEEWFIKGFVKDVESYDKPVALTLDGHGSHLTYATVKAAIDNGIIIICLPPHTSHALQPLDVGVFRGVKALWKNIINDYFKESRMQALDKAAFPKCLARLWPQLNPVHAVNGFRGSGLYPVSRNAVDRRLVVSENGDEARESGSTLNTPKKLLREAIVEVVAPKSKMGKIPKVRKRVQAKTGEVLTEEEVLKRLQKEAEEREAKKTKNSAKKNQDTTAKEKTNKQTKTKERKTTSKKTKKTKSTEKLTKNDVVITDENDLDDMEAVEMITKLSKGRDLERHTEIFDSDESDNDLDLENTDENMKVKPSDLEEGVSHVIVQYEGSFFPGIVTKLNKNSIRVKCMMKGKKMFWKWPASEDIHDYPLRDIVVTIKSPTKAGRGEYSVPEVNKYWGGD